MFLQCFFFLSCVHLNYYAADQWVCGVFYSPFQNYGRFSPMATYVLPLKLVIKGDRSAVTQSMCYIGEKSELAGFFLTQYFRYLREVAQGKESAG